MQAEVPAVQVVEETVEIPQAQVSDEIADTHVAVQHQVPIVQEAQMTHGAPQLRQIPTNTNESEG